MCVMMPMLLAATIELNSSDFTMIPIQSQSYSYTMPVYDAPGPWQNEDNSKPILICKPVPGSKTKFECDTEE